ncbi:MAG: RNA polymerase sigma factor [Pseudomonadota bacterium]
MSEDSGQQPEPSEQGGESPEQFADVPPGDGVSELYEDTIRQLSASLRKQFGAGPPDPEDIAQQAFEGLLKREDLSSVRNPRAFLWGAARNLMINAKRSLGVAARNELDVETQFFSSRGYGIDPERVISAEEEIKLVNETLKRMPERRRRAYYLRRVESLTITEIAKRLKISQAAASKHIARASADIDRAFAASDAE